MFDDPVFFMLQYFECKQANILNSHITWCPKITVFKNPRGGGISYLAHGLLAQEYILLNTM